MHLRYARVVLLVVIGCVIPAACGQSVPPVPPHFGAAQNLQLSPPPAARGGIENYRAVPLPPGFVPFAIMKDGQVPGSRGDRAAVYKDGDLTVLPKSPDCAAPTDTFITATSANSAGEIVGYCSGQRNSQDFARALYFNQGAVKVLPLANPQFNNWIQALTINDSGEIMGSVTNTGTNNAPASLARFYTDGRVATFLTGSSFGSYDDVVLNNSGHFVYTNGENIDGLFWASIGNDQGIGTKLVPSSNDSFATWMNERDSVVGYVGGFGGGQAFVDGPKGLVLIPLPQGVTSMMATGINDSDDVIGAAETAEGGEIFSYSHGSVVDVSALIEPKRNYSVLGPTYGILPGLSDQGAFVASVEDASDNRTYFFVRPSSLHERER